MQRQKWPQRAKSKRPLRPQQKHGQMSYDESLNEAKRCCWMHWKPRRRTVAITRHTSCFIGRSTGRKFRPPRGLSVPKDSELSTSHGELEAHEPFELTLSKPTKVEIGGGEYEFVFEQKS
uniref:Uncharacterized protein n=1 Tax=Hyaloperonospora arabidopsidis (strain Emoy2) TaxID=559515 RepID=M4B4T4_HYAAE